MLSLTVKASVRHKMSLLNEQFVSGESALHAATRAALENPDI